MTIRPLVAATVLAFLVPGLARGSTPPADGAPPEAALALRAPKLEVSGARAAAVAGTALVLWGAAAVQRELDDRTQCRWCEPGGFDRGVRDALLWTDNGDAGDASDLTLYAVTVGSGAAVAWQASREGDRSVVLEDVFLLVSAIAVTDGLTRIVQHGTGRLRPYAWASGGPTRERELRAFFSGHASRAFAAAAAATQVSRLRGRRSWGWVAAATFSVAAATGWLRIAADQHWATDVLAGAAAGTVVGWAVPTFALRPARERSARVLPAPGGIAVVF
jgi:hypothetical protein